MQPRTLDQISASLGSVYDPQVQQVQAQQALLPQQLQTDESALQGKQNQAYGDILSGARRRGTGVAFGGIPLGEQAQYSANTYMPALANLRGTYASKGLSLQDAILGINRDRATQSQGMFENERSFFEQQRQFNEQQEFAKAQAAAQERQAAAARAAQYNPTQNFGGGGGGNPQTKPGAAPAVGGGGLTGGKSEQDAFVAIRGLLDTKNAGLIQKTIAAIQASAARGNTYDQTKLTLLPQIVNKYYNGVLRDTLNKTVVANGGGLANLPRF